VIKASGNTVEAYWPSLFAKALQGQNIEDLLSAIGSAPVAAAPAAGASAAPAQAAAPAKKEEKKEEPAEEVDMGGLFGDDGY